MVIYSTYEERKNVSRTGRISQAVTGATRNKKKWPNYHTPVDPEQQLAL